MLHALIVNPAAGRRDRTAELAAQAKQVFGGRGVDWLLEPTHGVGDARKLARDLAARGEPVTVYACGGDGTLGEVAQGLSGAAHCRLAPVPIGTGNDLVRCFAPDAAERFYQLAELLDGVERRVDLLSVEGRVCLNLVSCGLDAAVAQLVGRYKRWPLINGQGAYALAVARALLTSVKNRYALELDGQLEPAQDYLFVVAANGRYYGGGFHAAPPADLQDGLLDVVCIPSLPRYRLPSLIGCYRRGEHLDKPGLAIHRRCRQLRLHTDGPATFNLDGEILTFDSPSIEVCPGALRLVVPRCYAAQLGETVTI